MIVLKNIKKSFGETCVLKNIDLQIREKEIVSIVGPSGAGKTTVLQIMGTLERPDSGEVCIAGEDVALMNSHRLAQFRNQRLGFVFQFHHLLAEFTALENVMIPAMIAQKSKAECRKRASELLEMFGLSHRLQHKPHELSGGEQQRVAVARALVNQPRLLLADEPSGNLDTQNAAELHQLFFDLRERFGQTIVIVTHNEHLAEMSDRKIQMLDGRLVD